MHARCIRRALPPRAAGRRRSARRRARRAAPHAARPRDRHRPRDQARRAVGRAAARRTVPPFCRVVDTRRRPGGRRSALGYFLVRLIVLAKRRLLWRVRRKLILSVHLHRLRAGAAARRVLAAVRLPAVLQLQLVPGAEPAARAERSGALPRAEHRARDSARRRPRRRPASSRSRQANAADASTADVSIAVVPVGSGCAQQSDAGNRTRCSAGPSDGSQPSQTAGPWAHVEPPRAVPALDRLLRASPGVLAVLAPTARRRPADDADTHLLVRGVAFPDSPRPGYAVVVDLLVNDRVRQQLRAATPASS